LIVFNEDEAVEQQGAGQRERKREREREAEERRRGVEAAGGERCVYVGVQGLARGCEG